MIHRTRITAKDCRTAKDRNLTSASEFRPPRRRALGRSDARSWRALARNRGVSPATVVPRMKADQSPVTAADEASEAVILQGLARLLPKHSCRLGGIGRSSGDRTSTDSFLIVDPLDGTREFLAGRDEFTVNLAIVTRGCRSPESSPRPNADSSGAASSARRPSVSGC